MTKITVDSVLRAKLVNLKDELELCDETGHTIGHFLPGDFYKRYRDHAYAWANCQVTDDELERASQEPGGRTLAETWQRLGRQ
jgi:hypothetical protein